MPEASKLALLREDIDRNPRRIKAVLNEAGMRREFFNGIPDDEEKAVKAFVSQNQENALKTKPRVGSVFSLALDKASKARRERSSLSSLPSPLTSGRQSRPLVYIPRQVTAIHDGHDGALVPRSVCKDGTKLFRATVCYLESVRASTPSKPQPSPKSTRGGKKDCQMILGVPTRHFVSWTMCFPRPEAARRVLAFMGGGLLGS